MKGNRPDPFTFLIHQQQFKLKEARETAEEFAGAKPDTVESRKYHRAVTMVEVLREALHDINLAQMNYWQSLDGDDDA